MGMERRLSSCSIKADRASEAVQPAEQGWHRVMLGSDTLQWHNQSFRGRAASRDPAVGLAALNLTGASREGGRPAPATPL